MISSEVLGKAELWRDISRQLDMSGILPRDKQALAHLRSLAPLLEESKESALKEWLAQTVDLKRRMRVSRLIRVLNPEGFKSRWGKLYDTSVKGHFRPLSEAPHLRGVTEYDMVLAPDFSPVDGIHGVFIAEGRVTSAVLPAKRMLADWELRAEQTFSSDGELIEAVRAISAGFGD